MRNQTVRLLILIFILTFVPAYSQNIVNISMSKQELKNGMELFNQRKYAAAIQAFELSLSYEPQNYAAKYYSGLAFLYAGYVQQAIDAWEYLVQNGVADYQVTEQLNSLYFQISEGKNYNYQDPYVFREYYDGFSQGGHALYRSSFIEYDNTNDRKFISSIGGKQVVEMNSAGEILQKYGSRFFLPSALEMPMGLALYSNLLYVADFKKNKIVAFNRNVFGTKALCFGETGALSNQMNGPMGLLISEDQYLYVVDNGNGRVHKFLPDGTHVYVFGKENLFRPTDIVEYGDYLYVSDIDSNNTGRVAVFDKSGNFLQYLGQSFLKQPRGLTLENNELYISDGNGLLYIYNLDNDTSRLFDNDDQKLCYAFDMAKDKDGIMWRTDFNSQNLAIYTPLQGVYGNISLEVSQTLLDQYPYVYLLVRARNKENQPVTHITPGEVKITEFNNDVGSIVTTGILQYRSNMLTTLIIDRSQAITPHEAQLEYFVKTFLSNNSSSDRVQLVLLDEDITVHPPQAPDVLAIWDQITNRESKSLHVAKWDRALYQTVTYLLTNLQNRAIIAFTSGQETSNSFDTYGVDVLQTYADRNSIPIYSVNLGSNQNRSTWKFLSESTHGSYYEANSNTKEILNLYTEIKESPPLEFLLEYSAFDYSKYPDTWIDFVLNFDRFGLTGVYKGGYYVPSAPQNAIDLQSDFFPPQIIEE